MLTTLAVEAVLQAVQEEAARAEARFGEPASAAESFGVLMREVAELSEAQHRRNMHDIYDEAVQVSAVALRMAAWALAHRDDESPRI